jgi:hypothetical protein
VQIIIYLIGVRFSAWSTDHILAVQCPGWQHPPAKGHLFWSTLVYVFRCEHGLATGFEGGGT